MKKLFSLILIAALALTAFSACGKTNETEQTAAEETSVSGKGLTTAPDSAVPVEQEPEGFSVACTKAEAPEDDEGKTFDFTAQEEGGEGYEAVPLMIRVTDRAGTERFSFPARLWCAKGMTELWDNENATPYPSHIAARRGSVWLLALGTEPEENDSWLLYDEDAKEAAFLGRFSRAVPLGDAILTHMAVYAEEFLKPVQVFDWAGTKLHTYEDVSDFRVSGDMLYLLAGNPTQQLLCVPAERFTQPGDLTAETLCSLTGFYARFSYEDGEEDVMRLTPVVGSKLSCPIAETPLYVGGKEGENLLATGAVKESCSQFTVTLPDFWKGKYICEKETNGLTFRHKRSAESPDRPDYGDLLFTLRLNEAPENVESYMSGDSACELCRLYSGDRAYDISLFEPGEAMCPPDCREEFLAMRAALLGSPRYLLEKNIEAAAGSRIEQYDYSGLIAEYSGTDEIGSTYTLRITDTRRNVLQAEIDWRPAENPFPGEYATAEIRMFGDQGIVMWDAPNAVYDEDEGYRSAYGDGYFRIQDEGTVLFQMNAEGDSWTRTDGYLTLTRG